MEEWDIYNKDLEKTGKICVRGQYKLKENEYHLVVHVWILTKDGRILLTQRSKDKETNPLKWEGPGGSVVKGEKPVEGAKREVFEEIGLDIPKEKFNLFRQERREKDFNDFFFAYYVIVEESIINEIKFLDNEAVDKKWVTIEKFNKMFDDGEIIKTLSYFKDEYYNILKSI